MREDFSPSTVVARSGGLIESEIDEEIVALNIETGTCYGLNGVGSRIWSLLEKPVPISEICATLIAEYQVEPDTCQRDVIELMKELSRENLIVVTDAA